MKLSYKKNTADRNVNCPVIYAGSLVNKGGTGVYLRRLLKGFTQCKAHVLAAAGNRLMKPSEALSADLSDSRILKVLYENVTLPALAASISSSIVHLPAFAGKAPAGIPCAVTLHDLAFCVNPSWFPWLKSIYYRLHFKSVALNADVIMVDSDFTGREAVRRMGIDPSRIRKVYLATESFRSDTEPFREYAGINGRHVLCAGTIEPRKNITALIDAWNSVLAVHPDLTLVIAGKWGWGPAALKRLIKNSRGVIWTGQLTDFLLKSCISGAELLVYPSFYEGFGLPPLEAASAGIPSVITPAHALVEIFSGISIIASDYDSRSIAEAIIESLDTKYDEESLLEFASRFSVKRMAEEVLAVYKEYSL